MSDLNNNDPRTERFNAAVRTFELALSRRQAKLMPFKDGIVELREKGASLDLIRELLATIDVAVGKATIPRFLEEISETRTSPRPRPRSERRRTAVQITDRPRRVAASDFVPPAVASPVQPAPSPDEHTGARPRTRGPRIADPRNL